MSTATRFDLTRDEIVARFRQRIANADRTRLTREERELLTLLLKDQCISLNQRGEDTYERLQPLCEAEKALLLEGYPAGSVNSVYLPAYTRLLKEALATGQIKLTEQNSFNKAWAKRDSSESGVTQTYYPLKFLTFDLETQNELRGLTAQKNNTRQDSLVTVELDPYLEQCEALLESNEPETLAIALAALIGRRHTEVVSKGTFTATEHPYKLRFEGQQKDVTPAFDILTLVPVKLLLPHLERFRALPAVQALHGKGHDDPGVTAFNTRVNTRVKKHFADLVPVLEGFKTVSIHRLRALYGAIAIHFFCPEHKNEHRFLQHYLGHLLDEQGQSLPNAAATQHYFHYNLSRQGTLLKARGVKVPAAGMIQTPEVPATEATSSTREVESHAMTPVEPSAVRTALAATPSIDGDHTESPSLSTLQIMTDQAHTLSWLTSQIERLQQQLATVAGPGAAAGEWQATIAQLQAENAALREAVAHSAQPEDVSQLQATIAQLQAENAALRAQNTDLEQAQAKLEAFKRLLANGDSPQATPATPSENVSTPEPSTRQTTDSTANTAPAEAIYQAVQAWNQQHPEATFAITQSLLERDFRVPRRFVMDFLSRYQAELDDYHKSIGATNTRSHNRQTGRDVEKLKAFVQQKPSTRETKAA
ncbi:protelomerase family protein [Stenomitos frigidus]|uniref:Telomere resolvase ResT/TelK catalytic domain-containing protein n=1 Tax=Stenomitos frigidus ULC18 TaxID=2107698 RepID=A0A2T1E812_9CYAN|nr:protelomerase family protein [Stenomitos frigidus]PSB28863.1 hypothetical protein C7B82_12490 [Stenomitos frigidus ULC18]